MGSTPILPWLPCCTRALLAVPAERQKGAALETTAESEEAVEDGYTWACREWGVKALLKLHPGPISGSLEGLALLEFYFGEAKYRTNMLRLLCQQCGVWESLTAKKYSLRMASSIV